MISARSELGSINWSSIGNSVLYSGSKIGQKILPVAEHSYLDRFGVDGGRAIDREEIDTRQLKRWMSDCLSKHPECWNEESPLYPGVSELPLFRLVDVQNECVVLRSVSERYFALSYVWGQVSTLKLDQANEKHLMSPQGLARYRNQIPRTIRDAIKLCRQLGEEYLWVDSLCLKQDDETDLAIGIRAMASIYERAFVTIIAGSGVNANSGLPGVEKGSRHITKPTEIVKDRLRMIQTRELAEHLSNSRYATRGWTFQEQYCSRRTLVFINQQVYFKCQRCVWSEETTADTVPKRENEDRFDTMYAMVRTDSHPFDAYSGLLFYYCRRRFTNKDDVLNAFTGITNGVASRMACKFIQGLPIAMLDACLLFRTSELLQYTPSKTSPRKIKEFRRQHFPSWSWVGWERGITIDNPNEDDSLLSEDQEYHEFNQWLDKRTWIVFYANFPGKPRFDHDPQLQELWDEYEMKRFQSLSANYVGYRSRSLPPWARGRNQSSEGFPTRPMRSIAMTKRISRDYPLLQFWTMTASFSLSSDGRCILDSTGRRCGTLLLDKPLSTLESDSGGVRRFLVMSESRHCRLRPDYEPASNSRLSSWQRDPQEISEVTPWLFFFVMLVEADETGVDERRGIGQIYQRALDYCCAPGMKWEEVILG
ncbi:hypothetical protein G7Y89_g10703 [Cudoniella acicularis]|uniref:Heterokaryon incompatibility domain-containing protein n=1 Tax=Cudoniella acicularis TaxID=354080 RepID=A0A8H4RC86_9HELO|nr:hypothetical protein G7Y89_g10703 [Cudoniella acicularis]